MNKINHERSQRFIDTLNTNNKLITAAHGKASDMLARSYFAHIDPDGNYVWPRIEAAGYTPYVALGENLAMDFQSAADVIDAWMNSPTHRENIINTHFQDQGLATVAGLYDSNRDTIIAVSLFGTLAAGSSKVTPPPPPVTTTPTPVPTTTQTPNSNLVISKNIKISTSSLSGHILVNVSLNISGGATLVTGKLKMQSITLLKGQNDGEFLGSFTFDQTEDLAHQTLTIEARNSAGNKITADFPLNLDVPSVSGSPTLIPVSSEAKIMKYLKYIFAVFATIYMIFLVIDWVIRRRHNQNAEGLKPAPHLIVFTLLIIVSLFFG